MNAPSGHHLHFNLRRSRRGFTLIGLLIVLAIIGILSINQMGGEEEGQVNYQLQVDRGKDAACAANRNAMKASLITYGIDNPGVIPTVDDLKAARKTVTRCPANGIFTILPDGSIHCTRHDPPITQVIRQKFEPEMADAIIKADRIQELLKLKYPDSPDIIP